MGRARTDPRSLLSSSLTKPLHPSKHAGWTKTGVLHGRVSRITVLEGSAAASSAAVDAAAATAEMGLGASPAAAPPPPPRRAAPASAAAAAAGGHKYSGYGSGYESDGGSSLGSLVEATVPLAADEDEARALDSGLEDSDCAGGGGGGGVPVAPSDRDELDADMGDSGAAAAAAAAPAAPSSSSTRGGAAARPAPGGSKPPQPWRLVTIELSRKLTAGDGVAPEEEEEEVDEAEEAAASADAGSAEAQAAPLYLQADATGDEHGFVQPSSVSSSSHATPPSAHAPSRKQPRRKSASAAAAAGAHVPRGGGDADIVSITLPWLLPHDPRVGAPYLMKGAHYVTSLEPAAGGRKDLRPGTQLRMLFALPEDAWKGQWLEGRVYEAGPRPHDKARGWKRSRYQGVRVVWYDQDLYTQSWFISLMVRRAGGRLPPAAAATASSPRVHAVPQPLRRPHPLPLLATQWPCSSATTP